MTPIRNELYWADIEALDALSHPSNMREKQAELWRLIEAEQADGKLTSRQLIRLKRIFELFYELGWCEGAEAVFATGPRLT